MSTAALTLVASVATLGAVLFVASRGGEPAPAASGAVTAADIQSLRDEIRALRDEVAASRRARADAPSRSAAPSGTGIGSAPATTPLPSAAPTAPTAPSAPMPPTDELADRVAEKLQAKMDARAEKVAGREYSDDGRWKAPIDDLVEEMKLSSSQKDALKTVFDKAKDQSYLLLKTQRLDGGTLIDDYANALRNQVPPEEATRELFRRVVSDKVPGSDDTYLAAFIAIGTDTHTAATKHLEPAQAAKFRALRVDVLDVKTGYDPVGDYIRAAVQ